MDIGRNLLKIRKFLAPHSKCLFTLVVANSLLFLVSNDILSTMQHETEIKVALAMIVHSHRAVCVSAAAATPESHVGPNEAHTRAAPLPVT